MNMHYWLAIASANHVQRGVDGGFMQVCHGKERPLKRLTKHDGVVYYSPSKVMGEKDGFQSFTSVGHVCDDAPYPFDMGHGFQPYRRNVNWLANASVPIKPLLQVLDITRGLKNWGYAFRFGLLSLSENDFNVILDRMKQLAGVVSEIGPQQG